MSTIYVAVAPRPEGVGVAVFHSSALARAGFIPDPSRGKLRGADAAVVQAVAVRRWWDAGPEVGGWGEPEVFVARDADLRDSAPLFAALAATWAERDRAYFEEVYGAENAADDDEGDLSWFEVVCGADEVPPDSVLVQLSAEEFGELPDDLDEVAVDAVAVGFSHVRRLGLCECPPSSGMCGDGPDRCSTCHRLVPGVVT